MADRVQRFDFSSQLRGGAVRTPQGFLRVPSNLTRTGVLTYTRADGTKVRELRPAEEVFKTDSLATLQGAPVTNRHPRELVTPRNVRQLALGHVGDNVRQDGDFVAADVTIQDHAMLELVERGDARELSCGYACRIDATPGEHNGDPYDVVQRDIRYNHVGIGPRNWGRAGSDVRLRLDAIEGGDSAAVALREDNADHADSQLDLFGFSPDAPVPQGLGARRTQEPRMDTITIKIDGLDVEVPKSHAPLIEKALADRDTKLDALTAERDQVQAKFDAAEEKAGKAEARADAAEEKVAAIELDSVREDARKVLGKDADLSAHKAAADVHKAVLDKVGVKYDGKSDAYIEARFDAAIESVAAGSARGDRHDARDALTRSGAGEDERFDARKAQLKEREALSEAWTKDIPN